MFTGNVFLTPGQELRPFTVKRPETADTEYGRVTQGSENTIGIISAILAAAKPEKIERWKQLQHPITHKIIQQGQPMFDVRPGDVFECRETNMGTADNGARRFVNQTAPYNVGDLGHWTIYYCLERCDV